LRRGVPEGDRKDTGGSRLHEKERLGLNREGGTRGCAGNEDDNKIAMISYSGG